MTHSLHRRGTYEELKDEYLLLVTIANGVNNSPDAKDKLRRVLDEMWDVGPVNTGSNETGTILSGVSVDEIKQGFTKVPRIRCCFDSKEKIREMLKRMIAMDLGVSTTISGPRKDIEELCQEFGIHPHSANLSLQVWGTTERLPEEDVMKFITMCGHGLISRALVEDTIQKVKAGRMTPEQGAVRIGTPCVCGFFNPTRAVKLLQKYVPQD